MRNRMEAKVALCAARDIATSQGARPMLWRIHAARGKLYRAQGDEQQAADVFAAARDDGCACPRNDSRVVAEVFRERCARFLLALLHLWGAFGRLHTYLSKWECTWHSNFCCG